MFCSSEGTVVLIHGFAPPGLAFNHRGWGQFHTHSIFTRWPQGEPAAFSICRSPYADRRTVTASGRLFFGPVRDGQNFPPRSKNSGNDSRLSSLNSSALSGAERAGHPTRNQPPSVGGSVLAAPGTTPGAASRWLQIGCMAKLRPPKSGGTVAPSHQSDSDFRRGAKLF